MKYIILVFGILVLIMGSAILVKPSAIFGLLGRHSKSIGTHILAVVVRLILGVALITFAPESKYPEFLAALGWIVVVAAIVLAAIGRSRFMRLMDWAMTLTSKYGRYAGGLAIVFGGFLVHAVF